MHHEYVDELFQFIKKSPSCFHAIDTIKKELAQNGFEELRESDAWALTPGKQYFVTRNLSSIIAFKLPEKPFSSFHIVASHSDSPTFKVKANAEVEVEKKYIQLNTEGYGGMICSTWFDRPLSIAGRVLVRDGGSVKTKLLNIDRDLVMIPNFAIHLNRDINKGYSYNAQVDMLPLYGDASAKDSFKQLIAKEAGVAPDDLLGSDLFLYNRMEGTCWGANNEFISCPKLDDLECAFTSLKAFLAGSSASASVYCVFDNEEVGSGTKQGAMSTFLTDVLHRINHSLGRSEEEYHRTIASSFMLSADNAHALHPNHPNKYDKTNRVLMNEGIVIKHSANQKYCTDSVSAAVFKDICNKAEVPCQEFANRSDMVGGSTLGNLSNAHVSLNAVDIGVAQLAMHSCYETAGARDVAMMVRGITAFYNSSIEAAADGQYAIG